MLEFLQGKRKNVVGVKRAVMISEGSGDSGCMSALYRNIATHEQTDRARERQIEKEKPDFFPVLTPTALLKAPSLVQHHTDDFDL
jgi:hypothetical protein